MRLRSMSRLIVLLLVICGLSPLGKALLYPLEQRFPSWDAARGAPDGIIVLGASIEADLSVAHGTPVVRGAAACAVMVRDRDAAPGWRVLPEPGGDAAGRL